MLLSLQYPLAAQNDTIPSIPTEWPRTIQNSMNNKRDILIKNLKDYDKKVNDFNLRCTGTIAPDNTALIAACQKESDVIDIQSGVIDNERGRFLATFHDTKRFFAPNTDPNVVDTRNISSGLPKSIDDAIAGAYKNAPAGVSDRVRKGFQSVMTKDWSLAKAWFQDALKLEPDNEWLKKLIALCDYTPAGQQQTNVANIHKPASVVNANSPSQTEINQWFKDFNEAKPKTYEELTSPNAEKMRKYVLSLSNEEFKKLLNANLSNKQLNEIMFENLIKLAEQQTPVGNKRQ